MRLRAMRTPSTVTRVGRPVSLAYSSATYATGSTAACGSRMRGGLRPASCAMSRQDLAQCHVLAAENVALADAAAIERQQVARGDIVDVHDVESGVDVSRRPAAGGIEHDLTGGSRLDVSRPDRRRGVDDHDRHAARRRLPCPLLGEELRALVVADHVGESRRVSPRCRGRPVAGKSDGRHAARVYDAPHSRRAGPPRGGSPCRRRWCGRAPAAAAPTACSRPQREKPPRIRRAPARAKRRPSDRPRPARRRALATLRRSEPARTSARTCQPRASSARATAAPTNPVAPVTNALMTSPRRAADEYAPGGRSGSGHDREHSLGDTVPRGEADQRRRHRLGRAAAPPSKRPKRS